MALNFLDIEVLPSNGACIEDLLITICKWYKRNYEMMYMCSLSFEYDSTNKERSLGERLLNNLGNEYHAQIERYHGIRFEFQMGGLLKDDMLRLDRELSAGNPMIIIMDAYNIPWDPKYKRGHHLGHIFLAVGVDLETNSLYGTDPFFQKKMQRISFEDLSEGYKGCMSIALVSGEMEDQDLLLSELKEVLQTAYETKQPFQAIAAFAHDLRIADISIEMQGIYDIPSSPIYTNIGKVIKWRSSYARALEFVDQTNSRDRFKEIDEELKRISFQWASIRGFIAKSIILEDETTVRSMINNAADKLLAVAKQEEQIVGRILALLEDTSNDAVIQETTAQVAAAREKIPTEGAITRMLQLDKLFNNKGLGSIDKPGDIDSQYYYFSWDSDTSLELEVGGISFRLDGNSHNGFDNIACNAQSIDLEPGYYSTLTTVGCSVMGGYLDSLIVEYEDKTTESIDFGFSDWWENVSIPGEEVAWVGLASSKELGMTRSNVNLFANRRNLNGEKRAVRLILPMESNIHLFAASLLQLGK